jgi:hypothetical protein
MQKDLTYTQGNMFTTFYANTPSGVAAWNTIANELGGVAKVLNIHAASTIYQLKKAGYSVGKEKPSKLSIDKILNELAN